MPRCKFVLIDISGVLYVGEQAVPGATAALKRLREHDIGLRLLTNTTRKPRQALVDKLRNFDFDISTDEIITAGSATHNYLTEHGLRPHLLIHPDLTPEFSDLNTKDPNTVVVGDAGDGFDYKNLNQAFRVLMQVEQSRLIAMGGNRYFQDTHGLSLDMGPFVTALEMASGVSAETTGKPATAFYQAALDALGANARQTLMIGDDLENDIGGAQQAGLGAVLVRTGKYRLEDEQHDDVTPDHIADNFPAAVEWILADD